MSDIVPDAEQADDLRNLIKGRMMRLIGAVRDGDATAAERLTAWVAEHRDKLHALFGPSDEDFERWELWWKDALLFARIDRARRDPDLDWKTLKDEVPIADWAAARHRSKERLSAWEQHRSGPPPAF